jgi:hypothetical protein
MIIKAISLWEIWASAMNRGLKKNETRSWPTSHRGLLAIHAAKKPFHGRDYKPDFVDRVRRDGLLDRKLAYGFVLCIVELADCVRTELVRDSLSETELFYGDYSDKRFAWITQNRVSLPFPIPAVGRQGFFDWAVPREIAKTMPGELRESAMSQSELSF